MRAAPDADDLERTLSPDERERVGKFRFEKDRLRHLCARAILRNILSRYMQVTPHQVSFDTNAFGKPFLSTEGWKNLQFNLSHSDNLAVIAVALNRTIGVDVELVRLISDAESIAQHHFTLQEREFIAGALEADRQRAFYMCWTRKEAYVKAVGKGLSIPLDSFNTTLGNTVTTNCTLMVSDAPQGAGKWWIADLSLPPQYVGALVVEGNVPSISYRNWASP